MTTLQTKNGAPSVSRGGGSRVGAGTIFYEADSADPAWRDRAGLQELKEGEKLMGHLAEKIPLIVGTDDPHKAVEDDRSGIPRNLALLQPISLASLAGSPAPPQRWIVDGLIPDRTVTDLAGDGGVGKSLLALQLAVAMVTGGQWIGHKVSGGDVLYLSCEDELSTIRRRAEAVAASEQRALADLDGLLVLDLTTGVDTELVVADRSSDSGIRQTHLLERVRALISLHQPKLVVLDTRADMFAGIEIDRAQVRKFIRILRELCLLHDMAILMLSHPSRMGMSAGDGQSGSTAWGNSVRSRLYLKRPDDKAASLADPDRRVLSSEKANYGPAADEIILRWEAGAFRLAGALVEGKPMDREARDRLVERRFLELLREFDLASRRVNDSGGRYYAPARFSEADPTIGKEHFRRAMERLFAQKRIASAPVGPPSRAMWKIIEVLE